MTESQRLYQAQQETRRHNLEMERLGGEENVSKRIQAEASASQADTARRKMKADTYMQIAREGRGFMNDLYNWMGPFRDLGNLGLKIGIGDLFG